MGSGSAGWLVLGSRMQLRRVAPGVRPDREALLRVAARRPVAETLAVLELDRLATLTDDDPQAIGVVLGAIRTLCARLPGGW
jgi:hypothetical protein